MNQYDLQFLESYFSAVFALGRIILESPLTSRDGEGYIRLGNPDLVQSQFKLLYRGDDYLNTLPELQKLVTIKYLEYQKQKLEIELAALRQDATKG